MQLSVATIAALLVACAASVSGEIVIGTLPTLAHGVRGTLVAIDAQTLLIRDFEYDGQGPAVYIYLYERGATVDPTGGGIFIIWKQSSTNNGRVDRAYTGEDVMISLRDRRDGDTGLTLDNIGTFTVWCQLASTFFSRIDIPSNLRMAEIGNLPTFAHGVSGTLVAVDELTLLLKNFAFDGQPPATYFYVYERGSIADPDGGGVLINWRGSSDNGRIDRAIDGEMITISLRDLRGGGNITTVNDIGNFTVWCQTASVIFSRIELPGNLTLLGRAAPGIANIGSLPNLAHGISGELLAVDSRTLRIQNFMYDGQAPATHFYVYLRGAEVVATGGGIIILWSGSSDNGRIDRRISGEDFTISLRDRKGGDTGLTVNDIATFTVWCQTAAVFFSRINIPDFLDIPIAASNVPLDYCAQLAENYQVSWGITEDSSGVAPVATGHFQLCGCIETNQYMAFGISGSDTSTFMVGADVTVAWVDNGQANAVDYYLTDRQQCRGSSGVCPDTEGSGTQDVFNITGQVVAGVTCVRYSRLLITPDGMYDRPILRNQSQFVVWAIGPRAVEEGLGDLALFHTEWPRNGENIQLDFNTGPTDDQRCAAPVQCMVEMVCGWSGQTITAFQPTTFRVKIGPSGGERGYQSITGQSGWGIAFYLDNVLIPMLKLTRNTTYRFIVEAGNDPNNGPNYHPFYITNSLAGGILLDTPAMRASKNEIVYAGFNVTTNTPTAAGRHCQHMETAASSTVATNCDRNLQSYLDTLEVSCQGSASEAAILEWTPDEFTPDVVYYQCANHFNLGWKIELSDSGAGAVAAHLSALSLLLIAVFSCCGFV